MLQLERMVNGTCPWCKSYVAPFDGPLAWHTCLHSKRVVALNGHVLSGVLGYVSSQRPANTG